MISYVVSIDARLSEKAKDKTWAEMKGTETESKTAKETQ